MRPQPGNALQEGREKKGDSDTDLRGQISVLLFSSSLLFSGFWPAGVLKKGDSDTDLRGQISVLLFSSLLLSGFWPGGSWRFWPVGVLGSGP